MDNCLEKNIYDRQVKKQGMSDRVVDECNPDAHLSIKELTNLCYDKPREDESTQFKDQIENYSDEIMRSMLTKYKSLLSREPFCHESLLIDRKEKKLSRSEKKLAKRSYEIEKKASTKSHYFIQNINNSQNVAVQNNCTVNKVNSQTFKNRINQPFHKNVNLKLTRWIPAEVWQRQGMSSQEMKLPVDVSIPTNSNDSSSIVVKAGEKVMVLNSPKGVYMQLESGKIIAIKTSAEARKDKNQQGNKIAHFQLFNKRTFPSVTAYKEDSSRTIVKQSSDDSDNDDCILINDNLNENSQNSFDASCTTPKTQSQNDSKTIKHQSLLNSMPPISPLVVKESKSANIRSPNEKNDVVAEKTSFVQAKYGLNQVTQNHQLCLSHPDSKVPYISKITDNTQSQSQAPQQQLQLCHKNVENLAQGNFVGLEQPETSIQSYNDFETKASLKSSPLTNNVHNKNNYAYASSSHHLNYDMISHHNMENNYFQTLPTMQHRWDEKSPELYKQAFKISNIPAPYPSTAVCGMNGFGSKNDKTQQLINNSIDVEHFNSRPSTSYVQGSKLAEDPYHHSLNNFNYQSNNAVQPSTENNESITMDQYNHKMENNYSEHLNENMNAAQSNYQQSVPKYPYNYCQSPYLSNYGSSGNIYKPLENNTFPSVSTQYFMRKPSSFPTISLAGVGVGYNYADAQGLMKGNFSE